MRPDPSRSVRSARRSRGTTAPVRRLDGRRHRVRGLRAAGVKTEANSFGLIAEKTSGKVLGVEGPVSPEFVDLHAHQSGGHDLCTEDGKDLAITPEETAKALDLSVRLLRSGAFPSASMTAEPSGQPDPEQTLLGRGRDAMELAWPDRLGAHRKASGAGLFLLRVPGESTSRNPGQWLRASQLCTISSRSKHKEQAAELIRFLTTSTGAAQHIGADRGVPAVGPVRTFLKPTLDASGTREFECIERIGKAVDRKIVQDPEGSAASTDILGRIGQPVLFGKLSAQDGGRQFVEEMDEAIARG